MRVRLFKDFGTIFGEVFGSTSLVKADILRRLAEGGPATCSEIAARLGVERGGSLSRNLAELDAAFPKRRGMSIRTALVHEGELDEAVVRCGAFEVVLPFSRLLGIGD